MDIIGTYAFYLNKIHIAANFAKQYKSLHIMISRRLVIKYIQQMEDILEVFCERNDVTKKQIEEVNGVLLNLRIAENDLHQKEEEDMKKLYGSQKNGKEPITESKNEENARKNNTNAQLVFKVPDYVRIGNFP